MLYLLYFNYWRKRFNFIVMEEFDHYDDTGEFLVFGIGSRYVILFGKAISFGR